MAKIIAHRANLNGATENSLKGIENCISASVDGIELDIRHSEDGIGFIFHDENLGRTCLSQKIQYSDKIIHYTNSNVIKNNYRLTNGDEIPLLNEALDLLKDSSLLVFLEMKDHPSTTTLNSIKSYFSSTPERLRIISFDHFLLKKIKHIDSFWSNIKTLALHEFPRTTWLPGDVDEVDGVNSNLFHPLQILYLKAKKREVGLWWLPDKLPAQLTKICFPYIDYLTTDHYYNYKLKLD